MTDQTDNIYTSVSKQLAVIISELGILKISIDTLLDKARKLSSSLDSRISELRVILSEPEGQDTTGSMGRGDPY